MYLIFLLLFFHSLPRMTLLLETKRHMSHADFRVFAGDMPISFLSIFQNTCMHRISYIIFVFKKHPKNIILFNFWSLFAGDIEGSKSYGLNSTTQQSLFCPVQSAANSTRAIPSLGSPLALYYIVVLLTPALELVKGLERIKFSFHFTQKPLLCLFNEL